MQLSLLSLFYFIGFSHAVLLTVSLWRRTQKEHSGRILAAVLALMAYKLFEGGVMYSNLYTFIPHVLDWFPGVVLWIGPIFYGFIVKVSGRPGFTRWQWLLHLMPALFIFLRNLPQVFMTAEAKIAVYSQINAFNVPAVYPVWAVILLMSVKMHLAGYLALSWRQLKQLEADAKILRSDQTVLTLNRLKVSCMALIVLEAIWVTLFVLQQTQVFSILYYFSEVWLLFIALIVFTLGYYGLRQPDVSFSNIELELVRQSSPANDEEVKPQTQKTKYEQSLMADSTARELADLITSRLEQDKLFLNDKLTLTLLSEALDIKPHLVSQVINQVMNTNFYKLINKYRVEQAIALLEQNTSGWSIERVALESGFGNRVTFNKAFKEITGTTASSFKKSLQQSA